MHSKAQIGGHPIHPMLVALPIGMFVGTVGALLAHLATGDVFYFRAAMVANIAGVIAALVAAVPGAIDLFHLPRGSQARATGVKHASVALLTVGLFSASAAILFRTWNDQPGMLDATVPLAISLAGLLALLIAGFLGWSLVQTHHVGVKPDFRHHAHHHA